MRIRALDGFGTADRVVRPGEVVDLPADEATHMLTAGLVLPVADAPEAAAITPPENAATPKARTKRGASNAES